MKVAVSAMGKDLTSAIDPRFGRATYLLIVEAPSMAILEVLDNSQAQTAEQGVGISAAARVAQTGVEAVITGRVGPKAASVLEAAGVRMVQGQAGSVLQALEALAGQETPAAPAGAALSQNTPNRGGARRPGAGGGRATCARRQDRRRSGRP